LSMKLLRVLLLLVILSMWCFGALAQQLPGSSGEVSSTYSVWNRVSGIVSHLFEMIVAVTIFAILTAYVIRGVVRQAIERSINTIFTKPVNNVQDKLLRMIEVIIESSKEFTTFLKGARQAGGIEIRVKQFLPSELGKDREDIDSLKLAETYRGEGRLAEAINIYENLVAEGDKSGELLDNLGICYSLAGDLPKATEILVQAYQQSPDDAKICHNLGSVYYKKKEYKESLMWLEKAKEKGSENYQTFIYHGLALWQLGRYEKAIETTKPILDKAKVENSDDVHWIALANNNIAYFLFEIAETKKLSDKSQLQTAARHAEIACKLEPENPSFIDTMGCIKLWTGDYESALELFGRSFAAKPHQLSAGHYARVSRLIEEKGKKPTM